VDYQRYIELLPQVLHEGILVNARFLGHAQSLDCEAFNQLRQQSRGVPLKNQQLLATGTKLLLQLDQRFLVKTLTMETGPKGVTPGPRRLPDVDA
jgi:hypothetical protein